MSRKLRIFITLAAFVWQSLTMIGSVSVTHMVDAWEHQVVHAQDNPHHHHADQSLHMDDEDAVHHLHPDLGNHTAGLLSEGWPEQARVRSMSLPPIAPAAWISAFLEGPLRPPMLRA